jgi:tRNA(Ile2) C34 agmatinyltransferase TiaS
MTRSNWSIVDGVQVVVMPEHAYVNACEDNEGLCLTCGAVTASSGFVEPDAEGYRCSECDRFDVVGIELALVMGKIVFTEDRTQ